MQKRCPWCGKRIEDIAIDRKAVESSTAKSTKYGRCSHCGNIYSFQRIFIKDIIFFILLTVFFLVTVLRTDNRLREYFYILILVLLFGYIFGFIKSLTHYYVKVDNSYNKITSTDKYTAKLVKGRHLLDKKMYFLDGRFDEKKELYSTVSPIVIHSFFTRGGKARISFVYDHAENKNYFDREVQLYDEDMYPVGTIVIEKQ